MNPPCQVAHAEAQRQVTIRSCRLVSCVFVFMHKDTTYSSGPIERTWAIVPEVRQGSWDQARSVSGFRSLRLKVRAESYAWLNRAEVEVNQVWNWANSTSLKAARPFVGRGKFLSGFDLCSLSAGATEFFEHIGADTIQRICTEYAAQRVQAKKVKLRWRVSQGSRQLLGWVPFKAASLRRRGKYLRLCGKTIRFFEAKRSPGSRNGNLDPLHRMRWGTGIYVCRCR